MRSEVAARVAELSHRITAHAGGLELAGVTANGAVTVRFTGLCTGCTYRPLTMAGTVRPALLQIEGVTSVEATGSRISTEAEARLAALLHPASDPQDPPLHPVCGWPYDGRPIPAVLTSGERE